MLGAQAAPDGSNATGAGGNAAEVTLTCLASHKRQGACVKGLKDIFGFLGPEPQILQ